MDADFASFRRPADAGWRAPPDFGALVAFLAAAQAAQHSARVAVRLETENGDAGDIVAALIGHFAPANGTTPGSGVLQGRFNPAVSNSNTALTAYQPT